GGLGWFQGVGLGFSRPRTPCPGPLSGLRVAPVRGFVREGSGSVRGRERLLSDARTGAAYQVIATADVITPDCWVWTTTAPGTTRIPNPSFGARSRPRTFSTVRVPEPSQG